MTEVKILQSQNIKELEGQIIELINGGWKIGGFSGPGGVGFPSYYILLIKEPNNLP